MNDTKLYRTKYVRLGRPAGTIVVLSQGYDYGLARDDTAYTGVLHVTVQEIDDLSVFTIAKIHLEDYYKDMLNIDPTLAAPLPEVIDGKTVRYYTDIAIEDSLMVGQPVLLLQDDSMFRTSTVVSIVGSEITTKNSVYRKLS